MPAKRTLDQPETDPCTMISNQAILLAREIGPDAIVIYAIICCLTQSSREPEISLSYDRLNSLTGLRRQRISEALKILEDKGMIERHHRFGESTVYSILIP